MSKNRPHSCGVSSTKKIKSIVIKSHIIDWIKSVTTTLKTSMFVLYPNPESCVLVFSLNVCIRHGRHQ